MRFDSGDDPGQGFNGGDVAVQHLERLAIVLADADLDLATAGIIDGAFGSTGQRYCRGESCGPREIVARVQVVAEEYDFALSRRAVYAGPATIQLVVGRSGGPEFLDSELARLGHLANLAVTISRA